ncbi:hypothetical protein FOL47_000117 [Perkinsus chesapeaki]|uniref:Uncharacterized protein n=1 Tax=Perkinsus chesapeaki TaxID=330153 RepID=A0A7J6N231_PERCH|nr:hypothetical protein FOL47_000117 [Perkinsus chesapeaki]
MHFLGSIIFFLSAGVLGELDFSSIQLDPFGGPMTDAPSKDTTVEAVGGFFSGITLDPPFDLTAAVAPLATTETASPDFDFSGIQLDPLFDASTGGVPVGTTTAVGWFNFSGIELDPFDEPVITTMQPTTTTVVSGVYASSDSHGLATTSAMVRNPSYPTGQESSTTTKPHSASFRWLRAPVTMQAHL